jgi:hypothetical protein
MRGASVLTPRPIGLITGYVVTRFRCIVEPIPLKPNATDEARANLRDVITIARVALFLQIDHFVMAITSAEAILWHTTPTNSSNYRMLRLGPLKPQCLNSSARCITRRQWEPIALIETVPKPDECYPVPRRPPRCRLMHARSPASAGGWSDYHVRRNRADKGIP